MKGDYMDGIFIHKIDSRASHSAFHHKWKHLVVTDILSVCFAASTCQSIGCRKERKKGQVWTGEVLKPRVGPWEGQAPSERLRQEDFAHWERRCSRIEKSVRGCDGIETKTVEKPSYRDVPIEREDAEVGRNH